MDVYNTNSHKFVLLSYKLVYTNSHKFVSQERNGIMEPSWLSHCLSPSSRCATLLSCAIKHRRPCRRLVLLGCTFLLDSAGIPIETRFPALWKTGTMFRVKTEGYIRTYKVGKTCSVLYRNLICFIITPPHQLHSTFVLKIRIEEGQN